MRSGMGSLHLGQCHYCRFHCEKRSVEVAACPMFMPPVEFEPIVEFEVLYHIEQLACLERAPPEVIWQFAIDFHDFFVEAAEQPPNVLNRAMQAWDCARVICLSIPTENVHEGLEDDLGMIKFGSKAVNLRAG